MQRNTMKINEKLLPGSCAGWVAWAWQLPGQAGRHRRRPVAPRQADLRGAGIAFLAALYEFVRVLVYVPVLRKVCRFVNIYAHIR